MDKHGICTNVLGDREGDNSQRGDRYLDSCFGDGSEFPDSSLPNEPYDVVPSGCDHILGFADHGAHEGGGDCRGTRITEGRKEGDGDLGE